MAIAFVPPCVEHAVGDGVFDGAGGLVRVGAVGKAAEADVGADVAIITGDLLWHDVPELKLPDPGRIDHEAAYPQRNQPGHCRRVLALFVLSADLADAEG